MKKKTPKKHIRYLSLVENTRYMKGVGVLSRLTITSAFAYQHSNSEQKDKDLEPTENLHSSAPLLSVIARNFAIIVVVVKCTPICY